MVSTRRLGFTGDVMLGRLVDDAYRDRQRPPAALWGDLQPRLRGLDGLCIPLSGPLSTRETSTGHRFDFRADPGWSVDALRAVTVDCCSLATDHAMDFGPDALEDTLSALSAADIEPVGAGRSRAAARAPVAVDCRGLTVAVVGFTDANPADAATDDRPGAAYVRFDPDDAAAMGVLRGAVSNAARFDPDLVVASLHWESNERTQPPTAHQAVARKLADWGVDLVAGHSAHCFRGVEILDHGDSPTVVCYDMGEFVDDYAVDPTHRNDRGFLFELVVASDGTPLELELTPTEIDSRAVYRASRRGATWCRSAMQERSAPFETTFDRAGRGLVVPLV